MTREQVTFIVLIAVLVFLFAFVFAVLGKGEYEPSHQGNSTAVQASMVPTSS